MKQQQQQQLCQRLASIRTQWEIWSATTDTSTWDSTFLLRLIDEQRREIEGLRSTMEERHRS